MSHGGLEPPPCFFIKALTGTLEATTQRILGGVGKLGGNLPYNVTNIITRVGTRLSTNRAVQKTLATVLPMLGEAGENYLTQSLDPIIRNAIFKENNKITIASEDQLYSALVGFFTSGLINTVTGDYSFKKLAVDGDAGTGYNGSVTVGAVATKTANPFNLNPTHLKTLSNREFGELVDDVKVNGINEPIKYVKYNGEMYVVDGHHRLLAAKKLRLTDVHIEEVTLPYKSYKTFDDLFWGN